MIVRVRSACTIGGRIRLRPCVSRLVEESGVESSPDARLLLGSARSAFPLVLQQLKPSLRRLGVPPRESRLALRAGNVSGVTDDRRSFR